MSILRLDIALEHIELAAGELGNSNFLPLAPPAQDCIDRVCLRLREARRELKTLLGKMEGTRDGEN